MHPLSDYLLHGGLEAIGAVCGYYGRSFCQHTIHRLIIGVGFTAITTVATVQIIG